MSEPLLSKSRAAELVKLDCEAAVLALLFGVEVFRATFKARVFERLTGTHVTTWDAFWLDLRVVEHPEKRNP